MFFHEIGHLFHELLSHTRFARFHGTTVALDFGEAPSQMLENWCVVLVSILRYISELKGMARCYEPKVLERMSSHYQTKKPLDSELIQKIIQRCVFFVYKPLRDYNVTIDSRYVNVGLFYLNQVAFSAFDLRVHMDQGQPLAYVTICTSLCALTPFI